MKRILESLKVRVTIHLMVMMILGTFISIPAAAQQMKISISGPDTIERGQRHTWNAIVENAVWTPSFTWYYRPTNGASWITIPNSNTASMTRIFTEVVEVRVVAITGPQHASANKPVHVRRFRVDILGPNEFEVPCGGGVMEGTWTAHIVDELWAPMYTWTYGKGTSWSSFQTSSPTVSLSLNSWEVEELVVTAITGPESATARMQLTWACAIGTESEGTTNSLISTDIAVVDLPQHFELHSNFPNPFSASTDIRFEVPEESNVVLDVYDVQGRFVETLYEGVLSEGHHSINWNAQGLSSGIYVYRLRAGDFVTTKRMTLIK